jgi:hypothetical protein
MPTPGGSGRKTCSTSVKGALVRSQLTSPVRAHDVVRLHRQYLAERQSIQELVVTISPGSQTDGLRPPTRRRSSCSSWSGRCGRRAKLRHRCLAGLTESGGATRTEWPAS